MKKVLVALIALACMPSRAHAAAFDLIPVGARPVGMAGAYVAVADDAMATFYNPAGLAKMTKRRVETTYSDLYNLGLINRSYLAYAQPKLGRATAAISWNNLNTSQKVRFVNYSENQFGFSIAYPVFRGLNAGATLKYFWVNYDKRATGYGFDLALLLRFLRDFRMGVMLRNANHPKIRWESGSTDQIPINWEIGASYEPTRRSLISVQIDRSAESNDHTLLKLGGEYWLNDRRAPLRVALRSGVIRYPTSRWLYTGGFTTAFRGFELVYALQYHFDLDEEHTFSLNYAF